MSIRIDGQQVRMLREMRVMERKELADACGLSYATLYEIEQNRRRVRAETVRKLADVLGVEPRDLLGPARVEPVRPRAVEN